MRRICLLSMVMVCFLMLGFMPGSADPLLYLDFDNVPDMFLEKGDMYLMDWSDRGTSVTQIFTEVFGGADGVDIKVPDGDGINLPNTEGPQGGRAMLIESGGKEEGFNIEMTSPYHTYPFVSGDYTVEVCFWTATNNITGNTVGLQDLWSSDWPTGDVLTNTLRIIGNATGVGRPADDRHLEIAAWEADGTEIRVVSLNEITGQVWHTAQVVFDYNEANPANCSINFYLDGVLQGTANYDAAKVGGGGESFTHFWAVYGTPDTDSCRVGIGSWRFGLGCSMNRTISYTDNRGLQGAIDAFCISEGALAPGEFVLPGGFYPPPPARAIMLLWQLYE